MPFPEQHFGRHVLRRPAKRVRRVVAAHVRLRKAEIAQMDIPLQVEEDVLGLYVSVDNSLLVEVLDSQAHLREVLLR